MPQRTMVTGTNLTYLFVLLVACLVPGGQVHSEELRLETEEMACVSDPTDPAESRVLMRFPMPESLAGSTIDLAILRFTGAAASEDQSEVAVDAFSVCRAWSAEGVAWDEGWVSGEGAWDPNVSSQCDVPVGEERGVAVDVTAIVQDWVAHPQGRYGLVLVPFHPGVGGLRAVPGGAPHLYVYFSSARAK